MVSIRKHQSLGTIPSGGSHPARAAGSHIPRFLTLLWLNRVSSGCSRVAPCNGTEGSVTCCSACRSHAFFLGIVWNTMSSLLSAAVVAKLVDTVLAPLLLVRTRQTRCSSNAELWKGLGLALSCALVGCVTAIHFHRQREEIAKSQVTRVLAEQNRSFRRSYRAEHLRENGAFRTPHSVVQVLPPLDYGAHGPEDQASARRLCTTGAAV